MDLTVNALWIGPSVAYASQPSFIERDQLSKLLVPTAHCEVNSKSRSICLDILHPVHIYRLKIRLDDGVRGIQWSDNHSTPDQDSLLELELEKPPEILVAKSKLLQVSPCLTQLGKLVERFKTGKDTSAVFHPASPSKWLSLNVSCSILKHYTQC